MSLHTIIYMKLVIKSLFRLLPIMHRKANLSGYLRVNISSDLPFQYWLG